MSAPSAKGFDMAGHVVPGTVINEVYFAVPIHGTTGHRFETMADALAAGIKRAKIIEENYVGTGTPFSPRVTIDVRWVMTVPAGTPQSRGGSSDSVAQRFTYDSHDDAQEHLDRIVKYAAV